jgi:hypothetical protein
VLGFSDIIVEQDVVRVRKYARFELVEDFQLIVHLRLVQSDGRVAVTSVCKSGLVDRMITDSAGLSSRELLSDT